MRRWKEISRKGNKQDTLEVSLRAFLLLFLWLLTLLIVTPVDTIENNPSPYAKVFVSGSEQKIPFDPPVRWDNDCHRPANLMTCSDNGSQRFEMDNFHFSQKHTQGHATFEYLHKHYTMYCFKWRSVFEPAKSNKTQKNRKTAGTSTVRRHTNPVDCHKSWLSRR